MKTSRWFVSLVAVAGLVGCGHEPASNLPQTPDSPGASLSADGTLPGIGQSLNTANDTAQQSPQPSVTVAKSGQSLPVPNLIPPTTSAVHVPQSEVGRSDPFATILVTPTVSVKPSVESATIPNSLPADPSVVALPTPSLPSLPPAQTAPITQFPPVSIPNVNPPRRLSEAIEITGVVEVGGKTSVIVKAPDERSSRYVQVGDYLSNGKVLVKRVEMGMEPMVILEEDGAEVTRSVGGGSSLAGLL